MKIIIPARKGSKGIPFKNRKLFDYTAIKIPAEYKSITYVFSDDQLINERSKELGFKSLKRNPASASDKATTKAMMEDFCCNFQDNDPIVMLYLTYPKRKWSDVERAIKIFKKKNLFSLLCKKEVRQTPYLMMFDLGDGRGEQVIKHDLSRRQDYRKCFEISHYISIIRPSELDSLNNNLYNKNTYFMKIKEALDIDTEEDLECMLK